MATDGTSLESIESGDVANTADASRMQAILRDMNSSTEGSRVQMPPPPQMQDLQPMPARQPMPPMLQVSSHDQVPMQRPPPPPQVQYVPIAEEEPTQPKKNVWSSVLEQIRDPLFVVLLFFLLSLPVFHTFVGKYASWAFAIGGQLSWLGLGALALVAGIIFAMFRTGCSFAGF